MTKLTPEIINRAQKGLNNLYRDSDDWHSIKRVLNAAREQLGQQAAAPGVEQIKEWDGRSVGESNPHAAYCDIALQDAQVQVRDGDELVWSYDDALFDKSLAGNGYEIRALAVAPPPIPMVLFCPRCHAQHVDAADPANGWDNPPHKSHLCHSCAWVWRPADVETTGVQAVATKGKADSVVAVAPPPVGSDALQALRYLSNEVLGCLTFAEHDVRQAIGNTNYNLLIQRAEEGRAALSTPPVRPEK